MTDSFREVNKELSERSPQPQTHPGPVGRDDSAEDNETCSRPSMDLRRSPGVYAGLTSSGIPEL